MEEILGSGGMTPVPSDSAPKIAGYGTSETTYPRFASQRCSGKWAYAGRTNKQTYVQRKPMAVLATSTENTV